MIYCRHVKLLPLVSFLALLAAGRAEAYTVFVSNEKDNSISVINSTTLTVTSTFKVGRRPRGIGVTPDGKYLIVCASDDHRVEVWDTTTLKKVKDLPFRSRSGAVRLQPGRQADLCRQRERQPGHGGRHRQRQGKAVKEIPVGVEPEGMAVSPDGKTVINTSETTNMIRLVDAETLEVTDNVLVDSRPRFAEFTRDGSKLWTAAEVGGTVTVIDPKTKTILKKIEFSVPGLNKEAIQPVGVRVTKDGKKAFVALGRPTGSRSSTATPTRWRSIFWSASASGSSASRRTRSSCS